MQGLVLADVQCVHDALRSLTQARDLAHRLDDAVGVSASWANMGVAMGKVGLIKEALACTKRALSYLDAIANASRASLQTTSFVQLCDCYLQLQDFGRALDVAIDGIRYIGMANDPHSIISLTYLNAMAAKSLIALRRFDEAERFAIAAHELGRRPGVERALAEGLAALGLHEVATGSVVEGLKTLDAAIESARRIEETLVNVLQTSVMAFEIAGRTDRALDQHRELIRIMIDARMHAIQYSTDLLKSAAGPDTSQDSVADSATLNRHLESLANRSRRLLRRPSVVTRRWPVRGYLAKRTRGIQ